MQTITKDKIALLLQHRIGLSGVICEELVTQIFQSAVSLISCDSVLKIKNFGSFALHHKSARPGREWKTGTQLIIPAQNVVKFTPSRNLKERLNESK